MTPREVLERQVVGALLCAGALGADAAGKVVEEVRASGLRRHHFERPDTLGRLLEVCYGLADQGEPCDVVLVNVAIEGEPAFARMRNGWLAELAADADGHTRARSHAETLVAIATETAAAVPGLRVVTLDEFAAVDEPGAEAIVGTSEEALIPQGGDVMVYGDGGTGKTTLLVDLVCHLAAGVDWLVFPIAQPMRVLLVENEGPRPLFRTKLRRKLAAWAGPTLGGRVHVLEEPWGDVTLPDYRDVLAAKIAELEIDVLVMGPVVRSGMNEAGTLQEVREFMGLFADVRERSGRAIAVALVHHENKGGSVSGAWEGAGDTLVHLQGEGEGRTRLYVQKARWASSYHRMTLHLRWADGERFEVEEREEITEDTIAEQILDVALELPGASWTKIRDHHVDGVRRLRGNLQESATVRDRLIREGLLVNRAPREGQFRLWNATDPAVPRSEPGTDPERFPFPTPDGAPESDPFPRSSLIGNGERERTGEPGSELDENEDIDLAPPASDDLDLGPGS